MVFQSIIEKILYFYWVISDLLSFNQLVFLFFLYSSLGWLLEVVYRSARNRRLINPGILKGPIVPIYGIGGVYVTLIHLFIQDEFILTRLIVYAVSITVLEYLTGEVILGLFKKRYWDYSDDPLNIRGHICLHFSAAWALMAIIFEALIFPEILDSVMVIPEQVIFLINCFAFIILQIDIVYTFFGRRILKSGLNPLKASQLHRVRFRFNRQLLLLDSSAFRIRLLQQWVNRQESWKKWIRKSIESAKNKRK